MLYIAHRYKEEIRPLKVKKASKAEKAMLFIRCWEARELEKFVAKNMDRIERIKQYDPEFKIKL